jgi:large subunit ribosomal protein L30
MAAQKRIRIRQTRGTNKRLAAHRACVRGLGLRRIGHTVTVADTPAIRGMIRQVSYMVSVLES